MVYEPCCYSDKLWIWDIVLIKPVPTTISGVAFLEAHLTQWTITIICRRHTTIVVVVEAAISSFLRRAIPNTTWRGAIAAATAMTSLATATTTCTTTPSVGGVSRVGPQSPKGEIHPGLEVEEL